MEAPNLRIFDMRTDPQGYKGHGTTLSVSRNGLWRLNTIAVRDTGYVAGDRVALAQDENSPADWYLFKSPNGFPLRAYNGCLEFRSKALQKHLLASIEYKLPAGVMMLGKPITRDGGTVVLWPLITKSITLRARKA
jgi:hypothetical protein